jgi:hypothetical protein
MQVLLGCAPHYVKMARARQIKRYKQRKSPARRRQGRSHKVLLASNPNTPGQRTTDTESGTTTFEPTHMQGDGMHPRAPKQHKTHDPIRRTRDRTDMQSHQWHVDILDQAVPGLRHTPLQPSMEPCTQEQTNTKDIVNPETQRQDPMHPVDQPHKTGPSAATEQLHARNQHPAWSTHTGPRSPTMSH